MLLQLLKFFVVYDFLTLVFNNDFTALKDMYPVSGYYKSAHEMNLGTICNMTIRLIQFTPESGDFPLLQPVISFNIIYHH
ncbi:hypothetical protein VTI74DRAFT_5828 [Chaetomium olivicolor]